MYAGEYVLGESVPLLLRTKAANGVPTEPADAPDVVVWKGATQVLAAQMPVIERRLYPGTFYSSLYLGTVFGTGNYCCEFRWVLAGGYQGSGETTFRVLPGGHVDGSIVTMYFFDRPQARFLVQQAERGVLLPGKNPSI